MREFKKTGCEGERTGIISFRTVQVQAKATQEVTSKSIQNELLSRQRGVCSSPSSYLPFITCQLIVTLNNYVRSAASSGC